MARCRQPGFGRTPNLIFSVFLILGGILLFLANLDLLPISVHQVWQLWPLIFVAMGVGRLLRTRHLGALVVGGLLVMFGVIFTLVNVGLIRIHAKDDSWPLSMLFLALGIGGLAKVLEAGNPRWRQPLRPNLDPVDQSAQPAPAWPAKENWVGWSQPADSQAPLDESPILDNVALMASIKRRVESDNFKGGTLTAFWGSIELDLRRSHIEAGRPAVTLDANAVMGSIRLRIPETWRVNWNGINIMANFEDKTIPPITGVAAPQLIMTGFSIMGSIEVES